MTSRGSPVWRGLAVTSTRKIHVPHRPGRLLSFRSRETKVVGGGRSGWKAPAGGRDVVFVDVDVRVDSDGTARAFCHG